jgi:uncharacterized protein (TIGR00299 family) protein
VGRIGWLDCSSGVSGDMLLGALTELGALDALPTLVESLSDLGVSVESSQVARGGLRATAVTVSASTQQPHRTLTDVHRVIAAAAVPEEVRDRAIAVFERLAGAEASVHGVAVDEVAFHEVGAVDSIVDVLAGCLGLHTLGLDRLVVSTVALGGGVVPAAHGTLPVPTPAALALLSGSDLMSSGGGEHELATPTGLAIVTEWATAAGPMPAMRVDATGVGAGSRDVSEQANVVRLVVGESTEPDDRDEWLVVETNVDDLDPRLWPGTIAALLDAGAADAWLTPILMKKGRPAHTLSALVPLASLDAVNQAIFANTSTIGLRWHRVGKHALERDTVSIDVDGLTIRVKLAFADGRVVSATPEFDDLAAAAASLGVPVKDVLAEAVTAVRNAMTDRTDPPAATT